MTVFGLSSHVLTAASRRAAALGLASLILLGCRAALPATAQPAAGPPISAADSNFAVDLRTIPSVVYKEEDGTWGPSGTESWSFAVLVREAHDRTVRPVSATMDLMSGAERVRRVELSGAEVEAVQGRRYAGSLFRQEELFDLAHHGTAPHALDVDHLVYTLVWEADGDTTASRLEIPLRRYTPKTELVFPLAGPFMIAAGHAFDEEHIGSWSQDFADDIIALGDRYDVLRDPAGTTNEDLHTWGAEVLAPAAGTVVYARNDVPDNPFGEFDFQTIRALPDPLRAIGGNHVVIDHGNGEFSFLGHLALGSARVEAGDTVEQGEVLGLVGNSGSSSGPHLHYHLMDGPTLYRDNGLPTRFTNVVDAMLVPEGERTAVPNPKRGAFLFATPLGIETSGSE